LFLFLPVVLTVYALLPGTRAKNLWLLLASLFFYAWGEVFFIFLLLASTVTNYFLGLWVDRSEDAGRRKLAVGIAVAANIGLLAFFKYADLVVTTLNPLLALAGTPLIPQPHIMLPIGISFFTFHALSYVIDIYRRKWKAATDPKDVALYIFFFPQLIAGPILRWSAIAPQLLERTMSCDVFAEGVRRFVGGLAKKMIIANAVALPADQVFALPANELSPLVAWFGILCYTLQIYFDFSGYSDMAVGLGKMFGFKFLENFNFPYTAQSIRDFWRRWHISLSSWFRDYLYIPLGGNRVSEARNHLNLLIVFFLCGLWHGANWTFVVWGLYHGLFLVLERTRFGAWQDKFPRPARHLYTILIVMIGWVLFRADTFTAAEHYLFALFGLGHATAAQPLARYLTNEAIWALALGVPFCAPLWGWIKSTSARLGQATPASCRTGVQILGAVLEVVLVMGLLLVSAIWLAGGTYRLFISAFDRHDQPIKHFSCDAPGKYDPDRIVCRLVVAADTRHVFPH
jgi:alginate O-acetyltransferase complex protein AlgI